MLDHFDALRGAEFPHDNPELFSGPGWLAVEPCGGPKAIAWASRRDLHYGAPSVVAEPEPPAAAAEPAAPAELTDFDRLVAAVHAVVSDLGVAAELERFLRTGSAEVFAPEPTQVLVASGWRRLLSGVASDLAACGERPLDEWVAGLVGTCLGYDAALTAGVRRALRKRGVAAFGMLSVSV